MKTISVEELRAWLEEGREVSIVDVRPVSERQEWAIPGSVHIDAYEALKAHDPEALASLHLDASRPVVTVCAAGKTSQMSRSRPTVYRPNIRRRELTAPFTCCSGAGSAGRRAWREAGESLLLLSACEL